MYLRPASLDEACEALSAAPAAILAGGTDVYPALVEKPAPERWLDISRIAELTGIARRPDSIRIGARTTWTQIARADLPPGFDALRQAAREVGSLQIQNVATIGGNLCNASPAADGVPPLQTRAELVELRRRAGTRVLPLADFLLGNRRTAREDDEILTAILVPRGLETSRSAFLKLGSRRYLVISIVMVAAHLRTGSDGRIDAARVAVGSCSAVACRLPALEAALVGRPAVPGLGAVVSPAHLAPIAPIDDVRAPARYRAEAAAELVRRALDACTAAEP